MLQVVSRDIRRILTQRARYFNIVLDDVSITQLTFSRDYTAAVESKQVAQQDAERAKFVVRFHCVGASGIMGTHNMGTCRMCAVLITGGQS